MIAHKRPWSAWRPAPRRIPGTLAQLRTLRAQLDPFQFAQAIEHKLERLYALAHLRATSKPNINATAFTPVEKQAIKPITRRVGIPVSVGKAALARATRK